MKYANGITIRELKALIKDWPEEDVSGEPTEVWMETGIGLSSPVIIAETLNSRTDGETGKKSADLFLGVSN